MYKYFCDLLGYYAGYVDCIVCKRRYRPSEIVKDSLSICSESCFVTHVAQTQKDKKMIFLSS